MCGPPLGLLLGPCCGSGSFPAGPSDVGYVIASPCQSKENVRRVFVAFLHKLELKCGVFRQVSSKDDPIGRNNPSETAGPSMRALKICLRRLPWHVGGRSQLWVVGRRDASDKKPGFCLGTDLLDCNLSPSGIRPPCGSSRDHRRRAVQPDGSGAVSLPRSETVNASGPGEDVLFLESCTPTC